MPQNQTRYMRTADQVRILRDTAVVLGSFMRATTARAVYLNNLISSNHLRFLYKNHPVLRAAVRQYKGRPKIVYRRYPFFIFNNSSIRINKYKSSL